MLFGKRGRDYKAQADVVAYLQRTRIGDAHHSLKLFGLCQERQLRPRRNRPRKRQVPRVTHPLGLGKLQQRLVWSDATQHYAWLAHAQSAIAAISALGQQHNTSTRCTGCLQSGLNRSRSVLYAGWIGPIPSHSIIGQPRRSLWNHDLAVSVTGVGKVVQEAPRGIGKPRLPVRRIQAATNRSRRRSVSSTSVAYVSCGHARLTGPQQPDRSQRCTSQPPSRVHVHSLPVRAFAVTDCTRVAGQPERRRNSPAEALQSSARIDTATEIKNARRPLDWARRALIDFLSVAIRAVSAYY